MHLHSEAPGSLVALLPHCRHACWPSRLLYVPRGHSTHTDDTDPIFDPYVPDGHGMG